ncbi:MAG: TVP38/TMEM64 family protein [Lachnospiraceae bacterium]|nr:TVP38/TMEM64 family protein [Lachnospiraceae bacterium]
MPARRGRDPAAAVPRAEEKGGRPLPEETENESISFDQTKEKRKKAWIRRLILLAVIAAAVLCYVFIPSVNASVKEILAMFATGDFTQVRDFVAQYGAYAAVISFLLMIFQSVAAPLPAFLITFANANLFGWWKGAILSWTSAMAGAVLCFYIARILGRDVAEKLTSKSGLQQIDSFFEKYGRNTILICRLLPFVSFDLVSYAAGLTNISFWSFLIATGIGQLPATLVYSYVGGMLTGGARYLVTGLMILFALTILIFMLRKIYTERQEKKKEMSTPEDNDIEG